MLNDDGVVGVHFMKLLGRSKSGQILVIIPVLIVFLIGAILMHINIAIMAQNRVRLQNTADSAARNGAMVIAAVYTIIQTTNAGLAAAFMAMMPPCCEPAGKECIPIPSLCICSKSAARRKFRTCCGIWSGAHESAVTLTKTQDTLIKSIPALTTAAIYLASDSHHHITCLPANIPKPNLKRGFAVQPGKDRKKQPLCNKCYDLSKPCGFTLRDSDGNKDACRIEEKVNVLAYMSSEPAYGRAILGKLDFPKMIADSSGRPYYAKSGVNPRSDYLEGKNAMYCMFYGHWDAKLIKFSIQEK